MVTVAVGAVDDGGVMREEGGDVRIRPDASQAHIRWVWGDAFAAKAAEDRSGRLRWDEHAGGGQIHCI